MPCKNSKTWSNDISFCNNNSKIDENLSKGVILIFNKFWHIINMVTTVWYKIIKQLWPQQHQLVLFFPLFLGILKREGRSKDLYSNKHFIRYNPLQQCLQPLTASKIIIFSTSEIIWYGDTIIHVCATLLSTPFFTFTFQYCLWNLAYTLLRFNLTTFAIDAFTIRWFPTKMFNAHHQSWLDNSLL